MSDRDEPDSLRRITHELLRTAQDDLGLCAEALRALISTAAHRRCPNESRAYAALASLADSVMKRRPLADGVVDGFYSSARQGQRGETAFAGGIEAMLMHGYSRGLVRQLPPAATDRFLGLGSVWRGVDPPRGKRVIDVGCGSGVDLAVASVLSARSALLVGIDKRPDLLRIASEVCPQALFLVGDMAALPLADEAFDVVLANGLPPLQRPGTLHAAARTLHALAAPGGTMSATVIVASPALESILADLDPNNDVAFARGLATLISGKPTGHDVAATFSQLGSRVTLYQGVNPYRDCTARHRSALVTVNATKR
jgi:SAM-dependent methyltransferase